MKKQLIAGVALAALLVGPAVAADTVAEPGPTSMPLAAVSPSLMGGIQMSDRASMPAKFASAKPDELISSKLVGTDVYNNQNDKLGEIKDLVIDNGKTIAGVVVSVGGFLGIGEHYVLIDPATLTISDKNGSMKAFVDTSKDNLKAAPSFQYKNQSAT